MFMQQNEAIKPNLFIDKLQKNKLNKKIIAFAIIGIIAAVVIVLIVSSITYVVKHPGFGDSINETGLVDKPEHFVNDTITVVNQTGNQTITSTGSSTSGGSSGGGSGGSSGGGESGCSPSLNCNYYYDLGECGGGLSDGCSNVLECLSCLDGEVCVNGSCVAEEVSWDDYISYWKFDGDADDETGVNNGTIVGDAQFVVDAEKGWVLSLDGDGDWVDLGNDASLDLSNATNFTMSFWIYAENTEGYIYEKRNNNKIIRLSYRLGGWQFLFYDGTRHYHAQIYDAFPTGKWIHLAIAYDALTADAQLYKDGDWGNEILNIGDFQNPGNWIIGSSGEGTGGYFNGTIDDMMMFNRSLSADEILKIYNTQKYKTCSRYTDFDGCISNPYNFSLGCEWDGANCSVAVDTWYVRPLLVKYGDGDGSSYDNAWNNIQNIVWGAEGVNAGDDLYICGKPVFNKTIDRYNGKTFIQASGAEGSPITIRMDCPGDEGFMWGIHKDNVRGEPVWNGPDANGVYWTSGLAYGTPGVEFNGVDYVQLDKESSPIWEGHLGAIYTLDEITYVKTTDGSDPTGKIYSRGSGYEFDLGGNDYIRFYKCNFFGAKILDIEKSASHITFDDCVMKYYDVDGISIYEGNDFWTVRNSDLSYMGNGIYTHTPGEIYNLFVENNKFRNIGVIHGFTHKDGHAIGAQNANNFVIQNNTIWNTGAAIEFWSGNYDMQNNTVRYNFIKDSYVRTTGGGGITIAGHTALGKRHSYYIYGNIILNPGLNSTEDWQGGGIKVNIRGDANLHIYNNIIYNESGSHTDGRGAIRVYNDGTYFLKNVFIYNNIIYEPNYRYVYLHGAAPYEDVYVDNNIYYPALEGDPALIYLADNIEHDNNSLYVNPMFVSLDPQTKKDFRLQSNSSAIDAGVDVGLPYLGLAPDIGAYEYEEGSLPTQSTSLFSGILNWFKGFLTGNTIKEITGRFIG